MRERFGSRILLVLLALAGFAACSSGREDTDFDSDRWKAAAGTACDDDGGRVRARMLDDLRENHLTAGMEQRQVLSLLGRPDHSTSFRGHRTMEWATQPGLTRCWYLAVVFRNGRVKTTEHYY